MTIWQSKCTSLLLRSKPVQRNWWHFFTIFQKIVRVLGVNETKLPFRNAFLVDLFALKIQKASKNEERIHLWDSFWSLDLSLNPQPPNDAIWQFPSLFSFRPFFGYFLLFLEEKTKSIRFCTKLHVKATTILQYKCTSLLLCSKPVEQNWANFFTISQKIVRVLQVKAGHYLY